MFEKWPRSKYIKNQHYLIYDRISFSTIIAQQQKMFIVLSYTYR